MAWSSARRCSLRRHRTIALKSFLADALVVHGLAAQRFDCRGCGNSFGNPERVTLRSGEEDCLLATARLCQIPDRTPSVSLALRWGAFVAARPAGGTGAAAIAFWDAKPDGRG